MNIFPYHGKKENINPPKNNKNKNQVKNKCFIAYKSLARLLENPFHTDFIRIFEYQFNNYMSIIKMPAYRIDKFGAGWTKCRSSMWARTWWNSPTLLLQSICKEFYYSIVFCACVNPAPEWSNSKCTIQSANKSASLGLDLIDPQSSQILFLKSLKVPINSESQIFTSITIHLLLKQGI